MKRRPVKKGALRTYFANIVRTKKVRAATAAMPAMPEVDGDVPNLGIARALVVILVIHVVAIAGIFAHSHYVEEPNREESARAAMAGIEPVKEPRDRSAPAPRVLDGTDFAKEGDTWASIAERNGVDMEDLRAANRDRTLKKGEVLTIPPLTIVAKMPDEVKDAEEQNVIHEGAAPVEDKMRNGGDLVETTAAGSPQLIKPKVPRPATPQPAVEAESATPRNARTTAAAEPVSTTKAAAESPARKTYTVKQGDTFWKIAQANKTTDKAIMKANGISDAKKLKPGMQLRIP
ncbi:LysM peptidoglycan-binding domain-containing protein [Haloferula sp. BvORR071]|uniref:LysM peptidoglycan-binding domain-containing protein n=1 Tax=Haloferula sp. BvORR071 TaxID=1396141 RepID=UPI002240FB0F|nr:LysM peptidoglycan-binding domain-containing protein [Haloferula sp. BvORR071]